MKTYYIPILYSLLVLLVSCSDDEVSKVDESTLTCSDGILNGDEVTVDCGGACPGFCPLESNGILQGELVAKIQLDPSVEYRLTGPYLIRDKAQLAIPAGTVIKADPGIGAYIAVAQGGKLVVSGNAENPAIITSGAQNPSPGDWGGIVICGKAPIASGEIDRTDIIDIFYGGEEEEDTSGVINYLRIEYAGAKVDRQKKFDALAFYGVGAITTVTRVQTYKSSGNGIRFVGGNVNVKWLASTDNGENAVTLENGWHGNGDRWFLNGISKTGIYITKNEEQVDTTFTPSSSAIEDVSIIGPAPEAALQYSGGNDSLTFSNVYTANMSLGIKTIGEKASADIDEGRFVIDTIQFDSPNAEFVPTNYKGSNPNFYSENATLGAGNGALKPDWSSGWTIGLDE